MFKAGCVISNRLFCAVNLALIIYFQLDGDNLSIALALSILF
jgi:uncharacterized membrane protein YccC